MSSVLRRLIKQDGFRLFLQPARRLRSGNQRTMSAASGIRLGREEEGGWCDGPEHSALYAVFRPQPPGSVYQRIIEYMRETRPAPNKLALDVGCGPGQSTRPLSEYFERVVGVDVSKSQVNEASNRPETPSNVTYRVAEPEKYPVESGSCDLLMSVQACHWFDMGRFHVEAERVLAPGGTVALVGYSLPLLEIPSRAHLTEQLTKCYMEVYRETRDHFEDGRRHVENEFEEFELPFEDCVRVRGEESLKNYAMERRTTLAGLRGYLTTWSGFRSYFAEKEPGAAEKRLESMSERLAEVAGLPLEQLERETVVLRTPYFFRLGRKRS